MERLGEQGLHRVLGQTFGVLVIQEVVADLRPDIVAPHEVDQRNVQPLQRLRLKK